MSTAPPGRRTHGAPPVVPAVAVPTSPPVGLGPLPSAVPTPPTPDAAQPSAVSWIASDAWVLAAIRVCGTAESPGSMFDFVAACDALHHLIVSQVELTHAVELLLGAELIVADARGFGITLRGRLLVAEAARTLVGTRTARALAGQARNEAVFAVVCELPVRPVPWALPVRAYEAACLEYRHMMWTEHRRPDRRH
jgi:hypothetical protein